MDILCKPGTSTVIAGAGLLAGVGAAVYTSRVSAHLQGEIDQLKTSVGELKGMRCQQRTQVVSKGDTDTDAAIGDIYDRVETIEAAAKKQNERLSRLEGILNQVIRGVQTAGIPLEIDPSQRRVRVRSSPMATPSLRHLVPITDLPSHIEDVPRSVQPMPRPNYPASDEDPIDAVAALARTANLRR